MQLVGVEVVVLIGVQGDVGQLLVPEVDEGLPGAQPSLGVLIGDGLHGCGGVGQLLVHDPVAVVAALHPLGIGGVVVPGGADGGEANGQVVHVVDLVAAVGDGGLQRGEVHGGSLQLHAHLVHSLGQHGGEQIGNGVAVGVGPLDDQGLQLTVDILVTGAGAGILGAVGVEGPAVGLQQLLGLVQVLLIGVQVLVDPVLGLLILPLGQTIVGVDNGSVTAAVLTGELAAVQAVGNGLTDIGGIGGELAAVELNLAVAVAEEGVLLGLTGIHQVQTGVDGISTAALEQQIHGAGLQLVDHGVALDGLDDQLLNGGLHAAVVAGIVGVHRQRTLGAGHVEGLEQVGAAGDRGVVTITGGGIVDGLQQQFGGEVTGDGSALGGIHHVTVGSDDVHGTGHSSGVIDIVVEGQLLGTDSDGVGHVIHQMHTGEVLGLAVKEVLIAHQGVTGLAGIAVHAVHLGGALQQQLEDVVLGGDGSTVAPGQTVVDGDGVGLGAVIILGGLMAGHNGGVIDQRALHVGHNGGIAMDQVIGLVVGGVVGEAGVVEVVAHLGDGTDDQLAGRLCGTGALLGGTLGVGGTLRLGVAAVLRIVGDGFLIAAGNHGNCQNSRQKQRQQFSLFHAFLPFRFCTVDFWPGQPDRAANCCLPGCLSGICIILAKKLENCNQKVYFF